MPLLATVESFCKRTDLGSLPDPDLATLRHRFVCLHDHGRVDEIGKTPISQVQSVSGLPIVGIMVE